MDRQACWGSDGRGSRYHLAMSRCTAPIQGHRTSSAAAACPACGSRGYGRYYSPPPSYYRPSAVAPRSSSGGASSNGGRTQPRWSPSESSVTYTPAEVRALTPVRRKVEIRAREEPDLRDVFLCHAWDDRRAAAKELHDLLVDQGVSVWFSEKDIVLGQPFLREIDRGLAKSRTGLVLVTPALLKRVDQRGISDKELSELLARDLLIPVMHETSYDELRRVSPLLGSRNGLDTAEDSMTDIAMKIAELVTVEEDLAVAVS
ncbi:toll/interleukin-1 receptor domain-containing protein [Agromyces mediolanus]|uniref:toll/interleukin-1 receptor domain-containing protein n=2 Tax=Agromyces TaxID=33877 RepID=UPI0027DFC06E|nr:toll/interleukin-1 receptor domain-containing protein [Agromyces mediolanus]